MASSNSASNPKASNPTSTRDISASVYNHLSLAQTQTFIPLSTGLFYSSALDTTVSSSVHTSRASSFSTTILSTPQSSSSPSSMVFGPSSSTDMGFSTGVATPVQSTISSGSTFSSVLSSTLLTKVSLSETLSSGHKAATERSTSIAVQSTVQLSLLSQSKTVISTGYLTSTAEPSHTEAVPSSPVSGISTAILPLSSSLAPSSALQKTSSGIMIPSSSQISSFKDLSPSINDRTSLLASSLNLNAASTLSTQTRTSVDSAVSLQSGLTWTLADVSSQHSSTGNQGSTRYADSSSGSSLLRFSSSSFSSSLEIVTLTLSPIDLTSSHTASSSSSNAETLTISPSTAITISSSVTSYTSAPDPAASSIISKPISSAIPVEVASSEVTFISSTSYTIGSIAASQSSWELSLTETPATTTISTAVAMTSSMAPIQTVEVTDSIEEKLEAFTVINGSFVNQGCFLADLGDPGPLQGNIVLYKGFEQLDCLKACSSTLRAGLSVSPATNLPPMDPTITTVSA